MNARTAAVWDAPRWAKVETFVKDQALLLNLECKIDVRKGLIMEHGRVEVEGNADKCQEFMRRLKAWFEEDA